jgi:SAM-dependent methyltransferase
LERRVGEVARQGTGRRVLEIGSGRQDLGTDRYSMARLFPTDTFLQSDVNPDYGHQVVDVTSMTFTEEFDVVLCLSVLEHLADPAAAVARIHAAIRPGGVAVISTPFGFPNHDEPADYWRFTEHGLRRLTAAFDEVTVRCRGARRLPFTVMCVARKVG